MMKSVTYCLVLGVEEPSKVVELTLLKGIDIFRGVHVARLFLDCEKQVLSLASLFDVGQGSVVLAAVMLCRFFKGVVCLHT